MRDRIVLYGTLLPGQPQHRHLRLGRRLRRFGPALVRGRLLDLGAYPGLTPGSGHVRGILFSVIDRSVWRALDAWEGADPRRPTAGFFRRTLVPLVRPPLWAWVYVYAGDPRAGVEIRPADWRRHRRRKGQTLGDGG